MLTHIASVSRVFARLVPWAHAGSWVSAVPPCLTYARSPLVRSCMQGSVAGLEARNAQLVREVAELKSRLATAGSPNPMMRGSSSNKRTKTTTTKSQTV